jgi:cell division protease FtsH
MTIGRKGKTALVWIVLLAVVIFALLSRSNKTPPPMISSEKAAAAIASGTVVAYRVENQGLVLVTTAGAMLAVAPPVSADVWKRLNESEVGYQPPSDDSPWTTLVTIVIVAAAALIALVYFGRKMQGRQFNSIFELRKSKARPVADADKAKFADIGGNRAAVELLGDVVDYLRSPERWTKAGLRVPRGVLVVGPPGTGKTLLARAVAGETQAAYFYTSAAEFVEMFVGIGAARVRDTFEKATKQQPAVIFIDELDAVGRRRGSGIGTMHEEREQTLNQLLVLLDGMEKHARLVVMAATNRPDVLDPALLRSGRFDRVLRLELPTKGERLEILTIHTRNKSLDVTLDLDRIAAETDNFSGADLEALVNSAGLLAIRRTRGANGDSVCLTNEDFAVARQEMLKSNRSFDRLDSVLVESASQFAEPTGKALARVTLVTGETLEGQVLWMNAGLMKLRLADGSEVAVAKKSAAQIAPLEGTESVARGDFIPDRWAGRSLETS